MFKWTLALPGKKRQRSGSEREVSPNNDVQVSDDPDDPKKRAAPVKPHIKSQNLNVKIKKH